MVKAVARPRLLDLFCGAGGASMGYMRAGFHVTGVDSRPQPRYIGDAFYQGDALEYVAAHGGEYDIIHASPPCQAYTPLRNMWNARSDHPDLVEDTRILLIESGRPYIIENVPGAPLLDPILLCGSMFGLGADQFALRRHRLFETPLFLLAPRCQHGKKLTIGVYGDHVQCRRRSGDLPRSLGKPLAEAAMGIDWMSFKELSQAIPPAYTEFIGREVIEHGMV